MKMNPTKILLTAMLLLGMSFSVAAQQDNQAQQSENYDHWSISLHGGTMQFYGDISNNQFFPGDRQSGELSLVGHLAIHRQFTRFFGANLQVMYGSLASEEERANQYFKANILDYNLNANVSLSNLLNPNRPNKFMDVYGIAGLGYAHYRTLLRQLDDQTIVAANGYDMNGDKTDLRGEFVYTFGLGSRFKLSQRLDVDLQAVLRSTPTDNLDGISNQLTERDKYGYVSAGIVYKFGKNANSLLWDQVSEDVAQNDKIEETDNKVDSLQQLLNDMNNNLMVLMNQYEKENGPDADGDSVPDYRDVELNTPAGVLVDAKGVGIPNCCDPSKPGYVEPESKGTATLYSVFFALNSTYVTPLNHERIAIVANMLKHDDGMKIELVGSTCLLASDEYNIDLSKRRVETVKQILLDEYKIDPARITIKYVGESKPLNVTEKNKRYNRRVDIIPVN